MTNTKLFQIYFCPNCQSVEMYDGPQEPCKGCSSALRNAGWAESQNNTRIRGEDE